MSSENPPTARNTTITVPVGWQTRRTLDPVRAHALHEAVVLVKAYGDRAGARFEDQAIQLAEQFAAWLVGEDKAE